MSVVLTTLVTLVLLLGTWLLPLIPSSVSGLRGQVFRSDRPLDECPCRLRAVFCNRVQGGTSSTDPAAPELRTGDLVPDPRWFWLPRTHVFRLAGKPRAPANAALGAYLRPDLYADPSTSAQTASLLQADPTC